MPGLHVFQRGNGVAQARKHFFFADKAQFARGQAGNQIKADIRRRSAPRRAHVGVHLHVVRRQPVFPLGYIVLKKGPCFARQAGQRANLLHAQRAARVGGRFLHIPQKSRCEQKQRHQRQRSREPRGRHQAGHAQNRAHAAGGAHARAASGGVGGRHPVQQVFFGKNKAEQRAHDSVKQCRRRRGQRRELHDRAPPAHGPGGEQMRNRREEGVKHAQGKGGAQVEPHRLQQQRQQRGQGQTAQKVIEYLQP